MTDGGGITSADESIAGLTGYPAADFLSGAVTLAALFHRDDADVAQALFRSPASVLPAQTNFRLRHRSGKIVCVRCTRAEWQRVAPDGLTLALELQAATSLRAEVQDAAVLANFTAMMENTDDYIYFKDRNHVFTGASQTLVSITDPSEHWTDLIGKTDYDVFPEEYADEYYSLEKRVFTGEVAVAHEIQPTLDNQGRRGWVDNKKYPIKDAAGNIVGLFGIARDITATKAAEDARREALDRLQKLSAMVPGMVYQFVRGPDGSMSFPYVSDAVFEPCGVTPEDAMADSRAIFSTVHPDDLPAVLAQVELSARDLTPWTSEFRIRLPDGTVRWMFGKANPEREADGSVRWHGFIGDITDAAERKRAEADLAVAAIAFDSSDGMLVTDPNFLTLKVNRAFTRITGYGAAEVLGKHPRLMRSGQHEPAFYTALWDSVKQTGSWQGEMWNLRKDGAVYPTWLTVTAVTNGAGQTTHYVGAFTDVTERKRLEAMLQHSQRLEAVGQLAGGVAHDFNNLLVVILSYCELALESLPAGDRIREDLREIQRAGESAKSLTQQLLAFSRKQLLEPRTFELNRAVAAAEKMRRRLLGENIQVVTDLAPHLGFVRADPGQLDQVLMNLAINAQDAMPDGGKLTLSTANVVLDAAALLESDGGVAPGAFVELTVSDTGTGMDAATLARLFEPFFTTKELGRGTGLGLSMVYGIVRQSGGTIRVSSELGRGSTFKIYLPMLPTETAGAVDEGVGETPAPDSGTVHTETILLAEDTNAVRRLVQRILEEAGYVVLAAASGADALAVAANHPGEIHLLLTDVAMPGMSGPLLATRLLATRPSVKVLYVSGHTGDALGRHGVIDEATQFLSKPFTAAALIERVETLLRPVSA